VAQADFARLSRLHAELRVFGGTRTVFFRAAFTTAFFWAISLTVERNEVR
jgi:hypothetical protein